MDIFHQYHTEFINLVDALSTIHNRNRTKKLTNYCAAFCFQLRKLPDIDSFYPSREDISQELYLIWLQLKKQWDKHPSQSTLRSFLIQRSIWALRDWVKLQIRDRKIPTDIFSYVEKSVPNLSWLLSRTDLDITSFEKFILYRYFILGETKEKISEVIDRDISVTRKTLSAACHKLDILT